MSNYYTYFVTAVTPTEYAISTRSGKLSTKRWSTGPEAGAFLNNWRSEQAKAQPSVARPPRKPRYKVIERNGVKHTPTPKPIAAPVINVTCEDYALCDFG